MLDVKPVMPLHESSEAMLPENGAAFVHAFTVRGGGLHYARAKLMKPPPLDGSSRVFKFIALFWKDFEYPQNPSKYPPKPPPKYLAQTPPRTFQNILRTTPRRPPKKQ